MSVADDRAARHLPHARPARATRRVQHYHDILEASSDGIFVLVDGVFRYVNAASRRRSVGHAEALVGAPRPRSTSSRPRSSAAVAEELARVEVGAGRA